MVRNVIVKRAEYFFPSPNLYEARAHKMAHNFKKKRPKREKTCLIYKFKGRLGNVT